MLFTIADIPPMTDYQVVSYETLVNAEDTNNFSRETQTYLLSLIFLKQANYLKNLHESQGDIRPHAERLAIASYVAYLERAGK